MHSHVFSYSASSMSVTEFLISAVVNMLYCKILLFHLFLWMRLPYQDKSQGINLNSWKARSRFLLYFPRQRYGASVRRHQFLQSSLLTFRPHCNCRHDENTCIQKNFRHLLPSACTSVQLLTNTCLCSFFWFLYICYLLNKKAKNVPVWV